MKDFIFKNPKIIIALTIILVVASVFPLTKTHINPDLESYLPESMQSRSNTIKIDEIFGNKEPIVIIFETDDVLNEKTLERIQNLSADFNMNDAFDRVYSLFDAKNINGDHGFLNVEPVIYDIPILHDERESLRTSIKQNDMVYELIVSKDFRYTMLMLSSNKTLEDSELIKLINDKLDEYPGDEKISMNSQAYLRSEANEKISRDFFILLPVGLLVMFVFLFISFREKRGVLLPISIVIISILISLSLLAAFGWELSLIGILIPIMMIAIANNYGIHVVSRYQEINSENPNLTVREITQQTVKFLRKPIILTGLTTIVGVLGIVTHILIPAQQLGIITAISIAIALLLSLSFIPAVLLLLKKGRLVNFNNPDKKGLIQKLLDNASLQVVKSPKFVVIAFSIFLIIAATGLFRFKLASDSDNILPQKHSFNQALNIANEHFGGIKIIQVLFEGDVREPEMMKRLDYYQTELEKDPAVGSVTSIAKIIRLMSKAINEPEDVEFYDKIPDSYEAISQYLELYSMSGDPEDFEEFIDFNYSYALLNVQFKANDLASINSLLNKINNLTKDDPSFRFAGGFSLIDKELSEAVIKGQFNSLVFAFVAILLLMIVIFRNFQAGLLGSLPLVFSVISTFGIMGWLGIELNIVTALLSSVSIGLGVDYTIHVFWRLKTETANSNNFKDAVVKTITSTGRGITINAFSVILGFSVLFLSAFPIVRDFAFLIIFSVLLCLMCSLLLIPALCIITKPKFLTINK